MGKCLLAFAPDAPGTDADVLSGLPRLTRFTDRTITSRDRLAAATTDPRAGLGAQRRGAQPRVRAVAAPVLDAVGSAVAVSRCRGRRCVCPMTDRVGGPRSSRPARRSARSSRRPSTHRATDLAGRFRAWRRWPRWGTPREQSGGAGIENRCTGYCGAPEGAAAETANADRGNAAASSIGNSGVARTATASGPAYRVAPMRRRGSEIVAATVLFAASPRRAAPAAGPAPGMPTDPIATDAARPPTVIRRVLQWRRPHRRPSGSATRSVPTSWRCQTTTTARPRTRWCSASTASRATRKARRLHRDGREGHGSQLRRGHARCAGRARDWNFGNPPGPTISGSSTPSLPTRRAAVHRRRSGLCGGSFRRLGLRGLPPMSRAVSLRSRGDGGGAFIPDLSGGPGDPVGDRVPAPPIRWCPTTAARSAGAGRHSSGAPDAGAVCRCLRLRPPATEDEPAAGVETDTLTGCAGGSEVVLCTIVGGTHDWPGNPVRPRQAGARRIPPPTRSSTSSTPIPGPPTRAVTARDTFMTCCTGREITLPSGRWLRRRSHRPSRREATAEPAGPPVPASPS